MTSLLASPPHTQCCTAAFFIPSSPHTSYCPNTVTHHTAPRGYTSYQQLQGGAVGQRLAAYCTALEAHPAVSATMYHPDGLDYKQELIKSYARYADGSANSMMARDAKSN